ncbi:condensin complex subunit 2/barren, partial [Syncephalis pseudoplumigaleata]
KINTSNTWNFALIDYFHNMTLLRDGDSINFQKASCTLDGCMKIYTSRVDSVATETGKLLSGLSESNGRHMEHGGSEPANSDNHDAGY